MAARHDPVPEAPAPVLEVWNLTVHLRAARGVVRAVAGVSLRVAPGEVVGIIGESGCGKSTLLSAIMGLMPPGGRVAAGEVRLAGRDLLRLPERQLRAIRGREVAMIFQDPLTALNPFYPVGWQIEEAMRVHGLWPRRAERRQRVLELMAWVGIPDPARRYHAYPHELSGGMQQRVMIAAALANHPRVLLADEPTTALDATVQAQILDLLERINREQRTAIVLVSHDLRLAGQFCHRIAVMYAGQVVEEGPALQVIESPRHPYTQALLRSLPPLEGERRAALEPIPGSPPDLAAPPPGCPFHPRCPLATDLCRQAAPTLRWAGAVAGAGRTGHRAACHHLPDPAEEAIS